MASLSLEQGDRLRLARLHAGFTLPILRQAKVPGVSINVSALEHVESAGGSIETESLIKLARDVYRCSLLYVYSGIGPISEKDL